MKVAVIGTGYVGLTTGVCLSFVGHNVTCLDVDAEKVEALRGGRTPIFEPHLEELMRESVGRLHFTTGYEEAIGGAEVVDSPFTVIVNKSTVPIGSGNWVGALIREAQKAAGRSAAFAVASNPEFLREGSAIADSLYPDRIVIGADSGRALELLYSLYRPVIDQSFAAPAFCPRTDGFAAVPLVSTDLASAELIKYAANAFLAAKISFINEIGLLAGRVGADIQHVARGIGLDSRIGNRFLSAGLGWGGSCFGKDTAALSATARDYGLEMGMLDSLKILQGRTIAILGLAFKPNTDDLRDAPAIDIIRRLIERGVIVRAHDPVAMERFRAEHPGLASILVPTAEAAVEDSDAVVLATEWQQYRELDWDQLASRARQRVLLDTRLALDSESLRRAGWRTLRLP